MMSDPDKTFKVHEVSLLMLSAEERHGWWRVLEVINSPELSPLMERRKSEDNTVFCILHIDMHV